VKFVPEHGTVAVRAWVQDGEVRFAVSDDGPGIAGDQIPHIFDRYWSGGSAVQQGVGLGLFIAKGIVDAHGGRLWVESEPGTGTTFTFSLPICPGPPSAPPQPQGSQAPAGSVALRGRKVLIVDDELNALSALASLLADEGLLTIEASSAEQALAAVEGNRPDVAMLDLELPAMNGLSLLPRLRERFPGLPAAIMSGRERDHVDIELALASKSTAYLRKPIGTDQVLDVLRQLLGA